MRKPMVLVVVGLVLLLGGGAVLLGRPVSFGWTSFTPLVDASSQPRLVVLDLLNTLALLGAAAGLALLSGAVGFRIAVRQLPGRDQ